jgi:hypothetical protein
VGYTIRQGLRVGASAYRGPYLDRQYAYFFPGEAPPRQLPATGIGIEAEWGRGPWVVRGEQQWFQLTYKVIPTVTERFGYIEARRVLSPRWYAAARVGHAASSVEASYQTYEGVIGFRPNTIQLIKVGYLVEQGSDSPWASNSVFAVQVVTNFRAISIAKD